MEEQPVVGGDTRLRVQLLGGFAVWLDGVRIPDERWRLRRARSLVKLLALTQGHRLHRDQVADTIWPGSDLAASANNFHQTLYSARRILKPVGADCLHLEEGFLSLCRGDGHAPWVDVEQFEVAAKEARRSQDPEAYRAALDLYQGDLLPDDLYEEWTFQRRDSLRKLNQSLQQDLALLLEKRGEYSQAMEVTTRLLSNDVGNEGAHAQLMRLYAFSGKKAQALRQYQTLSEALRRELDVEPGKATQQLLEDIQANRFPPPEISSPQVSLSYRAPAASYQNNLPAQLTSFIGREEEKARVCQIAIQHRLVTLTGPGGIGKTRLALEAAAKMVERYPQGVWLVELAPISDPALVPRAVAEVLKVPEQPGQEILQTLADFLKHRSLLLLLDNCEHVLAGAVTLVTQLLQGCPHLHILATSREILSVEGEVPFRCPSLSLPGEQGFHSPDELDRYEAVRLFIERVRITWPDFNLTEANAVPVAQICQRLDGIPLAIELAAARTRMLSLEQIAGRLDKAFHLLTSGNRSALPRHQTLRALIDWSYNLLAPAERGLLQRLSVFAGGWKLEAAEEIGADVEGVSGHLKKEEIVDLLGSLIDKSLIQFEPDQEEPRYRMLETVRQYSRERLLETGEEEKALERHLLYFLNLGQRAEPHLRAGEMVAWLNRLERELDNLRIAMTTSLLGEIEKGLQLATCLMWFWQIRNHRVEAVDWFERLLQAQKIQPDGDLDSARLVVRGRALNAYLFLSQQDIGLVSGSHGELVQESEEIFEGLRKDYPREYAISRYLNFKSVEDLLDSRNLLQQVGDLFALAECDQVLTKVYPEWDERAFFYSEEDLALRKKIGDLDGEATASMFLGNLEFFRGNMDRFLELNQRAQACYETVGNRWGLGKVLQAMAYFYTIQGDYQEALRQSESLLALAQELNSNDLMFEYILRRAYLAWSVKEYDQAVSYCEEALELGKNFTGPERIDFAILLLSKANFSRGEMVKASAYLQQYFRLEKKWEKWGGRVRAVQLLGLMAVQEGQMQQAAIWFGAQDEADGEHLWLLENLSPPERDEYEQALVAVRGTLGDEAFSAALEAGRAMTSEQVTRLALETITT